MTRTVDERAPAKGGHEGSPVPAVQAQPGEVISPGLANLAAAVAGTPVAAAAIPHPQTETRESPQVSRPDLREGSELDWKAISAALADQMRFMQQEHARTRQRLIQAAVCAAALGLWAASATLLLWL
jgi:hypothetical protein